MKWTSRTEFFLIYSNAGPYWPMNVRLIIFNSDPHNKRRNVYWIINCVIPTLILPFNIPFNYRTKQKKINEGVLRALGSPTVWQLLEQSMTRRCCKCSDLITKLSSHLSYYPCRRITLTGPYSATPSSHIIIIGHATNVAFTSQFPKKQSQIYTSAIHILLYRICDKRGKKQSKFESDIVLSLPEMREWINPSKEHTSTTQQKKNLTCIKKAYWVGVR